MGSAIADIMVGDVRPTNTVAYSTKTTLNIIELAERYNKRVESINSQFSKQISMSCKKPIPQLSDKELKKMLANECFQGNYDSARKTFKRVKDKKLKIESSTK